jgi:hypothetical protein
MPMVAFDGDITEAYEHVGLNEKAKCIFSAVRSTGNNQVSIILAIDIISEADPCPHLPVTKQNR